MIQIPSGIQKTVCEPFFYIRPKGNIKLNLNNEPTLQEVRSVICHYRNPQGSLSILRVARTLRLKDLNEGDIEDEVFARQGIVGIKCYARIRDVGHFHRVYHIVSLKNI